MPEFSVKAKLHMALRCSMIRFLRQLFSSSKGSQSRAEQEGVAASESICRYIFESSKYKISARVVKPQAFMPDPHNETSVFRISGQTDAEIWNVGSKIRHIPAIARGDLIAEKILDEKLAIR